MSKTKVEMGKKYRTRDGRKVRILCTDLGTHSGFCVVGVITNLDGEEVVDSWNQAGCAYTCQNSVKDLFEISPYEDWPIDAPVWMLKKELGKWFPRHFAGVDKDGNPLGFSLGQTSFTQQEVCAFSEAILASEFTPTAKERGK